MSENKKGTQPWIDPDDAPDLSEADLSQAVWTVGGKVVSAQEGKAAMRRAGRPKGSVMATHKAPVTLRIAPEALARWRASGKGWQTRAAAVLAAHAPIDTD